MTIGAILSGKGADVFSVECGMRVRDAVGLLADKHIGALPVLREGEVVGILSERDIVQRLPAEGTTLLDRTVEEAMSSPVITADRAMPVLAALSLMTKERVRHLPVVEDGTVIGFVSIGDLVKYRIDRIESEAQAMRSYIQGV